MYYDIVHQVLCGVVGWCLGVILQSTVAVVLVFFFQAEDGIRDLVRSRGLGDVYKRQPRGRFRA